MINFLTTKHVAEAETSVCRTASDGNQQDISRPPCLPDYQEFMRGVDLSDQRMSYYYVGGLDQGQKLDVHGVILLWT